MVVRGYGSSTLVEMCIEVGSGCVGIDIGIHIGIGIGGHRV